MDMMTARGIGYALGAATLLADIDLQLPCGEVTALLGPNGAGKSTLLKILAGRLIPDRGSVFLNGLPLSGWTRREQAKLRSVVPQDSHLPFSFTVREVVMMGRHPHIHGKERPEDFSIVEESMEAAGIEGLRDRIYPTLSGGERQRAQWAKALAQLGKSSELRGKYLLMDEPTSNLDPAHQHGLLELARGLARKGTGVLLILHDINLAAQYCDSIALLKAGKLVASGSLEAALTEENLFRAYGIETRILPRREGWGPFVQIKPSGPVAAKPSLLAEAGAQAGAKANPVLI